MNSKINSIKVDLKIINIFLLSLLFVVFSFESELNK